jgi:Nucleotidyl transferase AbiEii toxin, Type IV TA system
MVFIRFTDKRRSGWFQPVSRIKGILSRQRAGNVSGTSASIGWSSQSPGANRMVGVPRGKSDAPLPGSAAVTKAAARNIGASIRQRLLNRARESGRPFSEVLQYFAIERFLYRLTKSEHADKFILKGALMLAAWKAPLLRPTMDIDVLGRTANDMEAILTIVKDICAVAVQPEDGLVFNAANVQGERIAEAAEYEGVRVRFRATLDAARLTMQLDIGFGDVVVLAAIPTTYPTILDLPAPHLLGYSRESAVAEKFEAMVKLGELVLGEQWNRKYR